jgi:hypothetical protein
MNFQNLLAWLPALPASLMLGVGIPLGYALGTLLGDAYAGSKLPPNWPKSGPNTKPLRCWCL